MSAANASGVSKPAELATNPSAPSPPAKAAETTAKNIEMTRNQITRHESAIAAKRQEQEALRKQYTEKLERYRELKKKAQAAPASKP